MTFTTAALVTSWVAILVLALGLAGLMRQVTVLSRRHGTAGSGSGRTPHDLLGFRLPDDGSIAELRPASGGIVLFSSPTCPSCASVLADLGSLGLGDRLVVASTGPCPPGVEDLPGARCVDDARAAMDRLSVPATPYLVAVDAVGTITDVLLPEAPQDVRSWPPTVRWSRQEESR
jgi:hypothetical protein